MPASDPTRWQAALNYLRALVASWWFLVSFAGTVVGIVLIFLPPLTHAVPISVGVTIALVFWTAAPLRAYTRLWMKNRELEARTPRRISLGHTGDVTVNGENANVTINNIVLAGPFSRTEPVPAETAAAADTEAVASEGQDFQIQIPPKT